MKAQFHEMRIDWSEQDLLGHVNNVSIVKYCQSSRIIFLTEVGLPVKPLMEFGPIEAATSLQFKRQLHYPGKVRIYTTLQEVKNTSFIIEHRIFDDAGHLAVIGTEVIVCFDFVNQTKVPIPDEVRRRMAEYTVSFTEEMPEA